MVVFIRNFFHDNPYKTFQLYYIMEKLLCSSRSLDRSVEEAEKGFAGQNAVCKFLFCIKLKRHATVSGLHQTSDRTAQRMYNIVFQ